MDKYKTIKEASKAAIALGFNSIAEYRAGYNQDARLPANPNTQYSTDWAGFGQWCGFFGKEKKDFYPTIQEASNAAIVLGINSSKEYKGSYDRDERLPAKPEVIYRASWENLGTWYGFLGKKRKDF